MFAFFQRIIDGINRVIDTILGAFQWVWDTIKSVFTAAWDFLKDGVSWVLESLLDLVIGIVNSLDLSGVTGALGAWGNLPAGIMPVLQATGVVPALTVLSAAIVIRLLLQLIPFVRLGS